MAIALASSFHAPVVLRFTAVIGHLTEQGCENLPAANKALGKRKDGERQLVFEKPRTYIECCFQRTAPDCADDGILANPGWNILQDASRGSRFSDRSERLHQRLEIELLIRHFCFLSLPVPAHALSSSRPCSFAIQRNGLIGPERYEVFRRPPQETLG